MKKLLFVLALALSTSAVMGQAQFTPYNGGLFQRGETVKETNSNMRGTLGLPENKKEDNQSAPIGTGVSLLIGFGAAYVLYKKKSNK